MPDPPPALLAPGYRAGTLWSAQAPLEGAASEALPREADAVVVGGGYCGLAAARTLAERGRSVVVLDARDLGWGASSRNGGMVIPELKAGPAALEKAYGPLGRRLYAAVNQAFDHLEDLVRTHRIACDYERSGQLELAHHPRLVRSLRARAREHRDDGEDVDFVDRDELIEEIGSESFFGAVRYARTGSLHPARFHRGLLNLARAAGASLHPHTLATSIERLDAGFSVHTLRGAVKARDVIVATNAYADRLVPELRRRVLPVGSFILATTPLDADLAASVSPRGRMFVDTKNFLFYWRLSPDRRLIFGGRRSLRSTSIVEARDFLYASMLRIHPQLHGAPVEYAWGGEVAMTLDRLPHVGHVDGVLYGTGCNGSGVGLNTWLGTRLGGMLCGDDPPPFAELHHRAIPLWSLRRLYLPAVSRWFGLKDRYGFH